MRNFLIKLSIYGLLIGSIIFICILFLINQESKEKKSYVLAYYDKLDKLNRIKSPKLVIVGGSNCAFGFDSKQIIDSLSIPTINMGVNAGIGLNYMLYTIEPFVRKNDILLLSGEYEQYASDEYYGESALNELILRGGRWKDMKFINKHIVGFLHDDLLYSLLDILHATIKNNNKSDEAIYRRNSFNKYGDYIGHWGMGRMNPRPSFGFLYPDILLSNKLAAEINQLKQKGVHVFIIPPCIQKSSYILGKAYIDKIDFLLKQRNIPFLSSPERYAMDDTLIYDRNYHLTDCGAKIRTQRVIEDLKMAGIKKVNN